MSYRLIPHHIYYFSDIEICIVWRKIGVWRGTDTPRSQYLSHFIYPNSSLLGIFISLFYLNLFPLNKALLVNSFNLKYHLLNC